MGDTERFEKLLKVKKQKEEEVIKLSGQIEEKKKEQERLEAELMAKTGLSSIEEVAEKLEKDKKSLDEFIKDAEEILNKYKNEV